MKSIAIAYITSSVMLGILSIAVLGASGHQIFVFENPKNVSMLLFSASMFIVAIIDVLVFLAHKAVNTLLFLVAHIIAIAFKCWCTITLLSYPASEDYSPITAFVWIVATIAIDFFLIFCFRKIKKTIEKICKADRLKPI